MEKFFKYTISPITETKGDSTIHDDFNTKFVISPLEKGFGTTIGNAFRRTLLSSIEGSAIFAIKIPGYTHEFQPIPGVKEDISEIILNLKGLVLKISDLAYSDEELSTLTVEKWPVMTINKNEKGVVTASDIECPNGFEIINKDLYICEITNDSKPFNMEIYATRGRGFKSFYENRERLNTLNLIATDSDFSPIIRVGYDVENIKLSKTITGDTLTLSVATNGSIKAIDAVVLASKILIEHLTPILDLNEAIKSAEIISIQDEEEKNTIKATPIEELGLSVRSYNCLKRSGIQTVKELSDMTRSEVEKIKNLGKKSFREIQKHLIAYGVSFKE